jgi:hypothetical protein
VKVVESVPLVNCFGLLKDVQVMDYNVTKRQNHISGLSEGFTYDALDRLTQSSTTGKIDDVDYNYELLWFVEGCPSNGFIAIFGHAAIGIVSVGSVSIISSHA